MAENTKGGGGTVDDAAKTVTDAAKQGGSKAKKIVEAEKEKNGETGNEPGNDPVTDAAKQGGSKAKEIEPPAQEEAQGTNVMNFAPVYQLPSAEDMEKAAEYAAANPQAFADLQQLVGMVNVKLGSDKPAGASAEEMKATNYAALVKKYGKDFVTAKRGGNSRYFSRIAWNSMGKNKQGWEEQTEAMPEVQQ